MNTNHFARPLETNPEHPLVYADRLMRATQHLMPLRQEIISLYPDESFADYRYCVKTRGTERFTKILALSHEKKMQVLLFTMWLYQITSDEDFKRDTLSVFVKSAIDRLSDPLYAHIYAWVYAEKYVGEPICVNEVIDFLHSLCYSWYLNTVRYYSQEVFGYMNLKVHTMWMAEIVTPNNHPAFLPKAELTIAGLHGPSLKSLCE